jgi:Ca-activated chloride channel homolog
VRLRLTGSAIVGAAILAILGGLHDTSAIAQAGAPPKTEDSLHERQNENARFSVDTTLVLIPVNVTDQANRIVLNLQKSDFHLFEDGTEQTITHLSGEDAPLSVGLVVDTSGSMADKVRTSLRASSQFLETMNSKDEAFLIEFSDHAKLAAGFTNQIADIQNQLAALQPGGLTAMLDAIEMALREMKKAKNARKAIVIVSDGGDNNSGYSVDEIESLIREADVQIYAMGVFEPIFSLVLAPEEISGPRLLSKLAEQTGGRACSATNPEDLPSIATRIGIELRNQYVLAYTPKNQTRDGKYRRVEVKLTPPAGLSNLKIRWRLGYYAPAQ